MRNSYLIPESSDGESSDDVQVLGGGKWSDELIDGYYYHRLDMLTCVPAAVANASGDESFLKGLIKNQPFSKTERERMNALGVITDMTPYQPSSEEIRYAILRAYAAGMRGEILDGNTVEVGLDLPFRSDIQHLIDQMDKRLQVVVKNVRSVRFLTPEDLPPGFWECEFVVALGGGLSRRMMGFYNEFNADSPLHRMGIQGLDSATRQGADRSMRARFVLTSKGWQCSTLLAGFKNQRKEMDAIRSLMDGAQEDVDELLGR